MSPMIEQTPNIEPYVGNMLQPVLRSAHLEICTCGNTMKQEVDQQRIDHLVLMNNIACKTNAALYINDFLPSIATDILQALGWDRIIVHLFDKTTPYIAIDQHIDQQSAFSEKNEHATRFLQMIEELNKNRLGIWQCSEPSVKQTQIGIVLEEMGLETLLSLVLHDQDTQYGTLLFGSTKPRSLTADDLHIMEEISHVMVAAIKRIAKYTELEQANHLKTLFLRKVVHDMRTPAVALRESTKQIQKGAFDSHPEQLAQTLEDMSTSSDTLTYLIDDFLDFSKMEAGYLVVDMNNVDLSVVVHRVCGIVRPLVEKQKLMLQVDIAPDLPFVQGNSRRLEQVLTNLVSNAIKFTKKGSITIQLRQQGEYVCMIVQDTGIGILPEHHALVFGEYQQIKNQQTMQCAGTGLGLAISREFVQLMGGSLTLESEYGVGTTFTCVLRAATE